MKALALVSSSLIALAISQTAAAQDTPATADSPATEQAATSASSASSEDDGSNRTGDIIVTGTKFATTVQDTPIAITAVTSETLRTRGLTTAADLGNVVPNATFRKSEGIFGPAVSVYLRGIGQTDPQFNGEPSVAYYIDDVYYPFLFGSQFDLLDLDHVEVLRGPQGTLFGRNAIAGAVNLVSRTPSLTDSSAYVEVTVGSYNRRDLRAGFSVPLTSTLAFDVSMLAKKRDGYQDMVDFSCQMHLNGTPNLAGSFPFQTPETTFGGGRTPTSCVFDHLGGENTRAIRSSLFWQPLDSVEVHLSGDYTDQDDEVPAEYIFETDYLQTYGLLPDGTVNEARANRNFITMADRFSVPGTPFRWDKRFQTGDPYKTYDNFCDPFPAGTQITGNTYYNGSVFRGGKCYGNTVPLTNRGIQGKIIVGVTDQIDFTLIGGWRKMDLAFGAASDGTVLNDSIIYHEFHESHWSGEVRLTGQHEWLDWVAGVFYYDGESEQLAQPQGVRAGTQRYQTNHFYPNAWAGFANVIVTPIDGLNLTGGLRYSDDEKGVDFNSLNDGTPPGSTNFVAGGVSTVFDIVIESQRWDWKLGADYRVADDVMVYASAGTGYRLPGFNVRPSQPGQEGQTPGEALISYELGVKSELFDRRLKLNAAGFFMDFSERPAGFSGQEAQLANDLQHKVAGNNTVVPAGPAGTPFDTAFTTCRAYNATTDGPRNPDAGGGANPAQGVGVACVARAFSYAVGGKIKGFEAEVEAEPIDNLSLVGSVGYAKWNSTGTTRQTLIPEWTASAGVQYEIAAPMLAGSITPRLDWFYSGAIAYSSQNAAYDQSARSVVNARISYYNDEHEFEIAIGATNLFDKFYYYQKTIFRELGLPTNLGQPAAPREFYLSLKKRF